MKEKIRGAKNKMYSQSAYHVFMRAVKNRKPYAFLSALFRDLDAPKELLPESGFLSLPKFAVISQNLDALQWLIDRADDVDTGIFKDPGGLFCEAVGCGQFSILRYLVEDAATKLPKLLSFRTSLVSVVHSTGKLKTENEQRHMLNYLFENSRKIRKNGFPFSVIFGAFVETGNELLLREMLLLPADTIRKGTTSSQLYNLLIKRMSNTSMNSSGFVPLSRVLRQLFEVSEEKFGSFPKILDSDVSLLSHLPRKKREDVDLKLVVDFRESLACGSISYAEIKAMSSGEAKKTRRRL